MAQDMPDLPRQPAMFDPQPPVIGDPITANLAWELMNRAPELRKMISKIQVGTNGLIDGLYPHKDDASFPLNTSGLFNTQTGEININPHVGQVAKPAITTDGKRKIIPPMFDTLVHEMAHSQGSDEHEARSIEAAIDPELRETLLRRAIEKSQ